MKVVYDIADNDDNKIGPFIREKISRSLHWTPVI